MLKYHMTLILDSTCCSCHSSKLAQYLQLLPHLCQQDRTSRQATPIVSEVQVPHSKVWAKETSILCYQSAWFSQWPFLHYNEANHVAYCHICLIGLSTMLMQHLLVNANQISFNCCNHILKYNRTPEDSATERMELMHHLRSPSVHFATSTTAENNNATRAV